MCFSNKNSNNSFQRTAVSVTDFAKIDYIYNVFAKDKVHAYNIHHSIHQVKVIE